MGSCADFRQALDNRNAGIRRLVCSQVRMVITMKAVERRV
jgi:hypothetical protein